MDGLGDEDSRYCGGAECIICGEVAVQRCKQCKSTRYCSKDCQIAHWDEHKVICQSINQLQQEEKGRCKDACDFSSSLAPERKKKLLSLIGEKCTIACSLNGRECDALWDTGAQVSLISKRWLERHLKGQYEVGDISDIIGRDIKVKGAVGTEIPYAGYVVLDCRIADTDISVPFLVSNDRMDEPIVGFNVISHLVTTGNGVTPGHLRQSFPTLGEKTVDAVIKTLMTTDTHKISKVKLHKFDSMIKAGASISLPCRISQVVLSRQSPVLFEPESEELLPYGIELQTQLLSLKKGHNRRLFVTVTNNSSHDVRLPGRTKLGDLFVVSSVTPADVRPKEQDEVSMSGVSACAGVDITAVQPDVTESTDSQKCTQPGNELDDQYRVQLSKIKLPPELDEQQQREVQQMLWDERGAFAESDEVIGSAEDLQMDLTTTDEVPVQKRYNSIPRPLLTEVKGHIEDMLNRGWITRSSSAWSSPVVIVRKAAGDIRLCCDFRQLNQKTIADKHPLPRVQESLDSLEGSKWFSVMDLTRAYYQGYISPESRHKTAFVTPWGFYQWVRIPFGLMNAPANFQRYMENVISDLRGKCALPYLDDVIVHSENFNDHIQHIRQVLQRLRKHGLKLKASKCELFRKEVKFLGRVVTDAGYRMDDKNISAVEALKGVKPTDVSEVRQILGLLGYHRRHIQHFSQIAKPITDLLVKSNKETGKEQKSRKVEVEWTEQCQEALVTLIEQITTAPLLVYPDFSKEFVLHTDASMKGLGAILYQRGEGKDLKAIGYASRTLHKAEANYHPTKLEFLALKWSVTEAFREYLAYANDFLVLTDNNPLVYVMQATKLNAFGERWVSELAEYNFTIRYRPGITNKDADCLSRLPLDISGLEDKCTQEVVPDAFQAIMTGMAVQGREDEAWRVQIDKRMDLLIGGVSLQKGDEVIDMASAQEGDEDISKIVTWKKSGVHPRRDKSDSKELAKLKVEFDKLDMKDGVLVRKLLSQEQIVLPKTLRPFVFKQLHTDMGHLGAERVGELARSRVYWPWMQRDIEDYIQHKCACLKQRKPQRHKKAPLQRITTNAPLEMVTIDFLHLEKGSGGNQYILMIVDHFTKFVQAYPTRNKSTTTVAKHLYNDFILRFGIPTKLLSDQGGEFESKVIHELSSLAGVDKLRTTPYHPQTNGLCERMNRTLLHMFRTLPETMKTQWPSMVNKMTHAYNCTKHSTTGFTPFRLMFGREATLPIDLILGLINHEEDMGSYSKLAKKWDDQLKQAYAIVRKNMKDRQDVNASQCNRKPLLMPLMVGDRVLVKNTETGGPGKLRSYWEQDVYEVLAKKGDLEVVLEVRKENNPKARRRVIHRNMLLPVDDQFERDETTPHEQTRIPVQVNKPTTSVSEPRPTASGRRGPQTRGRPEADRRYSDSEADSDSEDAEEESFTPQQLHSLRGASDDEGHRLNRGRSPFRMDGLGDEDSRYCGGAEGGMVDCPVEPDRSVESESEVAEQLQSSMRGNDGAVDRMVEPVEVDEGTLDEMVGEENRDTFRGLDVSRPICSSTPSPVDKADKMEVGERTFEEMFGGESQVSFHGFEASRPPTPLTVQPASPSTVDLDLSESGPSDRPSPLKTFTARQKKRRDDQIERIKGATRRLDSNVSRVEVDDRTPSASLGDLSQWLRR